MTRWVEEEFEGVIAFVFIVVGAVLPWNLSIASAGNFGAVYAMRWWVGEWRAIPGIEQAGGWQWMWEAAQLQAGNAVFPAYAVWAFASSFVVLLLGLGVMLLVNEANTTDSLPVYKIAGGLFTVSGSGYVLATVHMSMNGFPGTYVPVGGLLYAAFGLLLLTNRGAKVSQFPAYCVQIVTDTASH